MSPKINPLRTIIVSVILALPLIAGALYVAITGADVSETWQTAATTEPATTDTGPVGAPTASGGNGGVPPEQLVGARRAAGEASTQAGFLVTGTGELVAGVEKLGAGAGDITGATQELTSGSQQLTDGLVQIQAGTGELGNAATQVADGVNQAVVQVQGVLALQPQLLAALDDADKKLAGNPMPDAVEARKQLADFRGQVAAFQLDGATVDQLDQLRSGSREVANQLTQPGAQYHDAIYMATDGSKRLTSSLREYSAGVDAALASVGELSNGVQRIDGMANTTKDKTNAVQRSLPANVPIASTGENSAEAEAQQPASYIPPIYAFLIASVVMVAGLLSAAALMGRATWWTTLSVIGLLTAIGGILFALLGSGITAGSALLAIGVIFVAAVVAVYGGMAVMSLFGRRWGSVLLIIGGLAQLAAVGWVWKTSAAAETATWAQVISALTPLHYPTSALTTIGNNGSITALTVAVGVLVLLGVGSGIVSRKAMG